MPFTSNLFNKYEAVVIVNGYKSKIEENETILRL